MAKHSNENSNNFKKKNVTDYVQNSHVKVSYDNKNAGSLTKKKKVAFITTGAIVVILAIVYLIGAWVFTFTFLPNSKIGSMDVSFKTSEAIEKDLSNNFSALNINVSGNDLDFNVNSTNAEISADTNKIVNNALSTLNIWKWPIEIFNEHDYSDAISDNLVEGNLGNLVQEKVDEVNKDKTDSKDAYLVWQASTSEFAVENEVYGTKIDSTLVQNLITNAIINMQNSVIVTDDQCIQPKILKSDSRWNAALKQANQFGKANFKIMMGDVEAATIDGSVIQKWLVVDNDLNVSLNSDSVNTWAVSIADGCNTVGTERTYVRPNGNKTITVSGGTYGWKADSTGLSDQIISNVQNGASTPISVNVSQSANALVPSGQADWGGRWIDVDKSEQHAYMYDNGTLIWETDIITGNPTVNEATPSGVWMVNAKRTNETLKGPVTNGQPEWVNTVQYWMPFIGNSHGLHDASWRSVFGGSVYKTADWSHGCINLPIAKATQLYELCKIGDAVIVHD